MDPATAAGIALAVLPLIVTVVEDYRAAIQPFITLKRYRKQARQFGVSLDTERTIFKNSCLHLLYSVTEDGPVMLENPGHRLWQDSELDRKLSAHLRDSLEVCISIIESIKDVLDEIQKESSDGFRELQKPSGERRLGLRIRMSQKFKLAFSSTDLNEKVELLQRYNTKLRVLCKQVGTLEKEAIRRSSHPKSSPKAIALYRFRRNASQRLYDTLSQVWSCSKHIEHSANIRLDDNPSQTQSDKACFDMVFTFSGPLGSSSMEKPMRVTIESMLEQPEEAAGATTQPESQEETIAKTVKFSLPIIVKSTVHEGEPLDLCSVQNICFHLQTCLQIASAPSPIGYLQRSKKFKYLIYPPKTITVCTDPAMSLCDTIRAAQTSGGIWIREKLRLAQLLALAVLQFHSTPWLDERWQSQNILFFDSKNATLNENSFGSPYLAARFAKSPKPAPSELSDSKTPVSKSFLAAPNAILFRLGIILLELGLEAPFADLQEPQEQKQGFPAEYSAASRLALSSAVTNKMGSRYAKLVNRCLFCDFGLGGSYELDVVELQNMFFQYVVMELYSCLEAARTLDVF